jgi:hypothetical protein
MNDSLHFFLQYYTLIAYSAIGIILLWIFIICIEYLLNKYYGYKRFNFSRTYYIARPRVTSTMDTI